MFHQDTDWQNSSEYPWRLFSVVHRSDLGGSKQRVDHLTNFPTWLSVVVSEIKVPRWSSIIYRCCCGFPFMSHIPKAMRLLPVFLALILPCRFMRRSVSLSTMTMYSGNILQKYLNTQTPRPVWHCRDLFSFRNSPTEGCCCFSSHPVKPACALYCVPN